MKKLTVLVLCFWAMAFAASAQLAVGEKIDFPVLTNEADGKEWNPATNTKQVVVVVFISHTCPYSKLYEDRLSKFVKDYAAKNVAFVFVNSNSTESSPDDSPQNMSASAKSKSFLSTYLSDKKQQLSDKTGASKTPEVFVFNFKNNNYYLKYKGAIDDNPQVAADVKTQYLLNAIEAVLAGNNPSPAETRATGCMIKR